MVDFKCAAIYKVSNRWWVYNLGKVIIWLAATVWHVTHLIPLYWTDSRLQSCWMTLTQAVCRWVSVILSVGVVLAEIIKKESSFDVPSWGLSSPHPVPPQYKGYVHELVVLSHAGLSSYIGPPREGRLIGINCVAREFWDKTEMAQSVVQYFRSMRQPN